MRLLSLFVVCFFIYCSTALRFSPSNTRPILRTTEELSTRDIGKIRTFIDEFFGLRSRSTECVSPGNVKVNCIPKLIRMGFHMAVGTVTGCINMNEADNAGLQDIAERLDKGYKHVVDGLDIPKLMSAADFWSLACTEAVIAGAFKLGKNIKFEFSFGRQSCSTSTFLRTDVHEFPSPTTTCKVAFAVFNRMGLTDRQAIALIGGGHSCGAAHLENSGYMLSWRRELDTFSNGFFKNLVTNRLEYLHSRNPPLVKDKGKKEQALKWQFNSQNVPGMMLNSDICMYRDITPFNIVSDEDDRQNVIGILEDGERGTGSKTVTNLGALSCSGHNDCQPKNHKHAQSDWKAACETFANSESTFFREFAEAWKIMLAHGNSIKDASGKYVSDSLINRVTLDGKKTLA